MDRSTQETSFKALLVEIAYCLDVWRGRNQSWQGQPEIDKQTHENLEWILEYKWWIDPFENDGPVAQGTEQLPSKQ